MFDFIFILIAMLMISAIIAFLINNKNNVLNSKLIELNCLKKTLEQQINEFTTLFNALPGYAFCKNSEGLWVNANLKLREELNVSKHEIFGKKNSDIFNLELAIFFDESDSILLSGLKKRIDSETTIVRKSITQVIYIRQEVIVNDAGQISGIIGIGFDITEKKMNENILRNSNARMEEGIKKRTKELMDANETLNCEIEERKKINRELQLLQDAISVIFIGVDGEGKIIRWNNAATHAFRIDFIHAKHKTFFDLKINWDWKIVKDNIQSCMTSGKRSKINNSTFGVVSKVAETEIYRE